MKNKEFEDWLSSRPPKIQELAKKYPPHNKYIIKDGAPYSISCPGTVVEIISYSESGEIRVAVLAKDKTKDAIEHEKKLGKIHNRPQKVIDSFKQTNISVLIDPIWITPVFSTN